MANLDWTWNETVLALDLYFRFNQTSAAKTINALFATPEPKSLHYKLVWAKLCGKRNPRRSSRIAGCSLGLLMHLLRISTPERVGRITSTIWICRNSSNTLRGS